MPDGEVEVHFPPAFEPLFQPARYKCYYGGRGGAKSWAFARALLILAARDRLRVLCTREVQNSIRDSVHKLLSDQAQMLGFGAFYTILRDEIRGKNGSEFIFSGLHDQTVESIKSFEGIDICWVEEAQAVSDRSWQILTPTIRKAGSEIWVSMNPDLDTDPTYVRFVVNPPEGSVVRKVNYDANPWLPAELEDERAHCEKAYPDDYANIWLGEPRAAVAGAIYAREITTAQAEQRFTNLPYDPKLKVHVVCDLGFNDSMAIIMVQKQLAELRVIDYLEDSHRTLDDYSAELRERRYNWGSMYLPHDAKHATLAAHGKSVEDIMRALGWAIGEVPQVGMEQGIKLARMALRKTWFDKTKAGRLIECLKRYRRAIPTTTGEPGQPVHDEYSHGSDAFRYLAVVADELRNEAKLGPLKYSNKGIV